MTKVAECAQLQARNVELQREAGRMTLELRDMRSELRERTVECEELQECNENLLSEADKAYHLPAM